MARILCIALGLLSACMLFGLGFLVGTGRGIEDMQRRAIAEGYAVRELDQAGELVFRWRSSDELERKPARRPRANPDQEKPSPDP